MTNNGNLLLILQLLLIASVAMNANAEVASTAFETADGSTREASRHENSHQILTEPNERKRSVESEEFLEVAWDKAKQEGVTSVAAGPATIFTKHMFYGETTINGNTLVHVVPRFPGTLKLVPKLLGDSIRAGDLLAIVESNQSLAEYQIKAEIDGVIIDQDATKGEFVDSNTILFKLANLDVTWVNVAIPPRALSSISAGTRVTVISTSTDARLETKITYVRPIISENTRMGQARLELPNSDKSWPPGMFVTVVHRSGGVDVGVAVPSSSVLLIDNQPTAFVKARTPDGDEGYAIRQLSIGRTDGDWSEVTSGLRAGETVANGNTFILKAELGKSAVEDND
jgi:cobalt-zinc-cadmium efflux system membrane fusion protein